MATQPVLPLPFPPDMEHEILDAVQLSDKPVYIRSKGSEVHVGTKIVFEIQNESDVEKLHPLIKSLSIPTSDLLVNNTVTEETRSQSDCKKLPVTNDNIHIKSDITYHSQNPTGSDVSADNTISVEESKTVFSNPIGSVSTDSIISVEESKTMLSNSIKSDNPLLLTSDVLQSGNKQCEKLAASDYSSRVTCKEEENSTPCAISSDSPIPDAKCKLSKLIMPNQPEQFNQYYIQQPFSMPCQQISSVAMQNVPYSMDFNDNSYSNQESLIHTPTGYIPNPSAGIHSDYYQNSQLSHPLAQMVSSVPFGSAICPPSQRHNNLPRVRLIDEPHKTVNKSEMPNSYWIPLRRNYMEERNFMLKISPGIFYNTPHGILVEMKNGSHYEIVLANNNDEDCDVDLFVDMELVYRIRLNAYSCTTSIDGPKNSKKKFVFLRAFDAPPEAGIVQKHERNGQIRAVFKPKMEEKRRAWSAVSCSEFLNQAVGNITASSPKEPLASPVSPHGSQKYRSGSLCSGATALQGTQREKYFEHVEEIKIDENRTVVLQLRLVARFDDQSRPSTSEPITPLITKMPPPLPF